MRADVERHCAAIEACNQRGGRMLSIVDLLDAGTLSRDLGVYALAAIGKGASFMVGALPGGAGKTTVMGALLNLVPADVDLVAADGLAAIEAGLKPGAKRAGYVCHEIGDGGYYAYLWGNALRRYFDLAGAGHVLATNLHADTHEQAKRQVCGDNDVPEAAFRRMNLLLFLALRREGGGVRRRVATVWESDGVGPHRLIKDADVAAVDWSSSVLIPPQEFEKASRTVDDLMASGARTIQEVRAFLIRK